MTVDKPLRADARRNRQRVLEVAERTFAANGLAVPMDEIAREAGVGVGTIYRQFPTKEALFGAIVEGRIRQLVERAAALSESDDPGAAFFEFLHHLIDQAVLNKALFEALSEAAGVDIGKESELGRQLLDAQAVLLARAQDAGVVRDDIDIHDLKALISGCLAIRSHGDDSGRLVDVVLDGLRTPK